MNKAGQNNITTLIFDFGGVLYKINPQRTYMDLLSKSGYPEKLADKSIFSREGTIFTDYETGKIASEQFRKEVIREFCPGIDENELEKIWNSLLIGPFPETKHNLMEYAKKYRLLLLSNTNEIHFRQFSPDCRELFNIFGKLYLSYEIGLRKPNREIYEYVLKDSGLRAGECLFIDDTPENIEGAKKTGIDSVLFESWESFNRKIKGILYESD